MTGTSADAAAVDTWRNKVRLFDKDDRGKRASAVFGSLAEKNERILGEARGEYALLDRPNREKGMLVVTNAAAYLAVESFLVRVAHSQMTEIILRKVAGPTSLEEVYVRLNPDIATLSVSVKAGTARLPVGDIPMFGKFVGERQAIFYWAPLGDVLERLAGLVEELHPRPTPSPFAKWLSSPELMDQNFDDEENDRTESGLPYQPVISTRFDGLFRQLHRNPLVTRVTSLYKEPGRLDEAAEGAGQVLMLCLSGVARTLIENCPSAGIHETGREEPVGMALNTIAFTGWYAGSECLKEEGWQRIATRGNPNDLWTVARRFLEGFDADALADLPWYCLHNFRGVWSTQTAIKAWGFPLSSEEAEFLASAADSALLSGYCLALAEKDLASP